MGPNPALIGLEDSAPMVLLRATSPTFDQTRCQPSPKSARCSGSGGETHVKYWPDPICLYYKLTNEREADFSDSETQGFRITGTVPSPQDFDRLVRFVDVVIDQVVIPQHFAGTGTLFDRAAR